MEVLSLSMVKVSKESVDNKGTITNHTPAVSFLAFLTSSNGTAFPTLYIGPYIYLISIQEEAGKTILVTSTIRTAPLEKKNLRLIREDNQ